MPSNRSEEERRKEKKLAAILRTDHHEYNEHQALARTPPHIMSDLTASYCMREWVTLKPFLCLLLLFSPTAAVSHAKRLVMALGERPPLSRARWPATLFGLPYFDDALPALFPSRTLHLVQSNMYLFAQAHQLFSWRRIRKLPLCMTTES